MARSRNLAPASDRASGVGGAFFMFMGQNHRYSERSHRRNPWEGVVGLDWRPPKPVVRQTELSRDNPVPEPARTERPTQPYHSPRPPSDVRAAHIPPRPARDFRAASAVAGRDFLDELDSDFDMDPQPYSGGVAGADPSLEMWVTGTLPGAPKPAKWTGARAAAASPRYAPPRYGAQQPPPRGPAGVPDDRRRQGDLSLATKKKVEKAVKLIRSILTSWDSSLRKIFNTIDADRGGTIDLDEFSDFVRRVLHLQFDHETMAGIMAEFGGGHAEINYQRFCELVMGQNRRDNSSLIFGNEHTANDVHSNSEMLMRKRIREAGKDLRDVFRDMDRDGSGAVSYDELKQLLRRFNIHMSDQEFQQMVLKIDENSDGEITYPELIRYFRKNQVDTDQGMIQKVKGMSVDEAVATIRTKILQRFRGNEASTRAAFRLFDKDGGGEVSVSEFQQAMKEEFMLVFDDDLATQIIDILDSDHSGSIGFAEFAKYIMGVNDAKAEEMSLQFGQPDHRAPPSQRHERADAKYGHVALPPIHKQRDVRA